MSYENAPATKLLATSCACCGRPLVDSESVERGVGPDCAEKYGFFATVPEAARVEANVIVHRIAAAPKAATVPADVERLRALGLAVLADKLTARLVEAPAISITVGADGWFVVKTPYSPAFVAAVKAVAYAERRWDAASKTWHVAPTAKAGLWAALQAGFQGERAQGPKGAFTIGAQAAPAPVAAPVEVEVEADDSAEPPAEFVREDGSVDCAAWYASAVKPAARRTVPVTGNFTRAEGTFSRDSSRFAGRS